MISSYIPKRDIVFFFSWYFFYLGLILFRVIVEPHALRGSELPIPLDLTFYGKARFGYGGFVAAGFVFPLLVIGLTKFLHLERNTSIMFTNIMYLITFAFGIITLYSLWRVV